MFKVLIVNRASDLQNALNSVGGDWELVQVFMHNNQIAAVLQGESAPISNTTAVPGTEAKTVTVKAD